MPIAWKRSLQSCPVRKRRGFWAKKLRTLIVIHPHNIQPFRMKTEAGLRANKASRSGDEGK